MTPDSLFAIANPLAMLGWIGLLAWPLARQPIMIVCGYAIPLALSVGYMACVLAFWGTGSGGYDSLPNVMALFDTPGVALAGWIHYLAFDLAIGGWIVRDASQQGIRHWMTYPSLVLTFLFGPIGLLLHFTMRLLFQMRPSQTA